MSRTNILQGSKRCCWYCGTNQCLEAHHIYFGKNRENSDKYGFWVWLCEKHHRGTCGVHSHGGDFLDKRLKRACQEKFEETHTREEFVKIIGRNYAE